MSKNASPAIQNSKPRIQNWPTLLFWLVTGLAVMLFCLRFVLRFVGVRPDTPFAGFVYSLTAPAVTPFYRVFPVSERFDYYAIEWATLLAAGCVLAASLVIYAAALIFADLSKGENRKKGVTDSGT